MQNAIEIHLMFWLYRSKMVQFYSDVIFRDTFLIFETYLYSPKSEIVYLNMVA